MKTDIYDSLFYMSQATSLEELTRIFRKIVEEYGFDQFAVQYIPIENKNTDGKPYALATFKEEWVSYYKDEGFHTIDPVVLLSSEKRKPFLWSNLWEGISMTSKQKEFFNEASEYGVGSGVGLPVPLLGNDPAIVSLVSSYYKPKEIAKIIKKNHLELSYASSQFQLAVSRFVEKMPATAAPYLTPREKECLTWAAIGKSDLEIGAILSISHRTVNHHLQSCYRKLECTSREQATVKSRYHENNIDIK